MTGYQHPTSLVEFEATYRKEYKYELESCDRWIRWCEKQNDYYGVNFHQGLRSALIFNNIKMEQLLRVLKQKEPNASTLTQSFEEEKRKLVKDLAKRIKHRLESLTVMAMIFDAVDEECRKSM